jgi:hypothetical protein
VPLWILARVADCSGCRTSMECLLVYFSTVISLSRREETDKSDIQSHDSVQRVVETPQFLLFSIAKGGTKTIVHLSIAEGLSFWSLDRRIYDCKLGNEKKRFHPVRNESSPQLSKLLYNCQLKNKEALQYFERLSEDVGTADFSKNLPYLSLLMKTKRMSLISAGSISLDSTFYTDHSNSKLR